MQGTAPEALSGAGGQIEDNKEDPLPEWILVKEAAEYTGYTVQHVRYLLRNGLVEGRKFGRDWFTTKEALDEYLATDPRPGPRSQV